MLISLLAALAAEPSAPNTSAPKGPEPVYDLAERDLRKLKQARMAQLAAVTLPAVFMAGAFAQTTLPKGPGGRPRINVQSVSAYSLWFVGGAGMMVSSTVFHRRTIKSRSYLLQQGLSVPRTPSVVVPALAIIGVLSAVGAANINSPGDQAQAGGLALGLGLYTLSVGVGTYQLDLNRRARRDAGWLGLAPMGSARTPGLAVVGQW